MSRPKIKIVACSNETYPITPPISSLRAAYVERMRCYGHDVAQTGNPVSAVKQRALSDLLDLKFPYMAPAIIISDLKRVLYGLYRVVVGEIPSTNDTVRKAYYEEIRVFSRTMVEDIVACLKQCGYKVVVEL